MSENKESQKQRENWFNEAQKQTVANPYNDLQYQFLTTEPAWGKESTSDLYEAMEQELKSIKFDDEGNAILSESQKKNLWGMLSYFTRDLRLGNISYTTGEVQYCRFWVEFAGDCLRYGLIRSFVASMAKAITTLELSQSKGGFFRRRANTITREDFQNTEKKSLFSSRRKEE